MGLLCCWHKTCLNSWIYLWWWMGKKYCAAEFWGKQENEIWFSQRKRFQRKCPKRIGGKKQKTHYFIVFTEIFQRNVSSDPKQIEMKALLHNLCVKVYQLMATFFHAPEGSWSWKIREKSFNYLLQEPWSTKTWTQQTQKGKIFHKNFRVSFSSFEDLPQLKGLNGT